MLATMPDDGRDMLWLAYNAAKPGLSRVPRNRACGQMTRKSKAREATILAQRRRTNLHFHTLTVAHNAITSIPELNAKAGVDARDKRSSCSL